MKTLENQTEAELQLTIQSARAELAIRAHTADPFGEIKGQECGKRALVVAGVQGHTVGFFGPHGCGKSMLVRAGHAIGVPALEGIPCPCGNFTHPRLPCKCTPSSIERHQKRLRSTVGSCDLHLECLPVPACKLLSTRLGTTIIQVREQLARAGPLPSPNTRSEAANILLRQVIADRGLSAATVATILSIAQSIAALPGSDSIEADHLLEAVHYRRLDRLTG